MKDFLSAFLGDKVYTMSKDRPVFVTDERRKEARALLVACR